MSSLAYCIPAGPVYHIPEKADYVVVADMFAEDYIGGAELTLEAILSKCPGTIFKIRSNTVTSELVSKYKDKYWILGNFSNMAQDALIELVTEDVKFSVIECDYKYCKYRSSHLHLLQEKVPCDCHTQRNGHFVRQLYMHAKHVFFMSAPQMQVYIDLFPNHPATNFHVQTSTFKNETLDKLAELRTMRKPSDTWAIMGGGSWIKAEQQAIHWCQNQGLKYEVFGGLPHEEFLRKLSTYKGLVFHPAGLDTCPRLVIEAKLLGLQLKLNSYVQHSMEPWFISDIETCEKYLRTRAKFFWDTING